MKRIMLACAGGMSTSLLASKMQVEAEKRGIEAKVWAIGIGRIPEESGNYDVLLLGPQVRHTAPELAKKADPGIAVEVINMQHYGMCNAPAVLDKALELIK